MYITRARGLVLPLVACQFLSFSGPLFVVVVIDYSLNLFVSIVYSKCYVQAKS